MSIFSTQFYRTVVDQPVKAVSSVAAIARRRKINNPVMYRASFHNEESAVEHRDISTVPLSHGSVPEDAAQRIEIQKQRAALAAMHGTAVIENAGTHAVISSL